ncbi:MAG: hypothetical protein H0T62_05915 [Parachlamydiaceae bacterium]|nr:hypothetical protein [Parachlamydiaceae bacterium]
MEITVNNTRFDITPEDIETADVEFSFWEGRRLKFCGKDVKEHFLRYNDIVKGVLAEDATFIEGEDKQKIYTSLNVLKDKGYPFNGSCAIEIMLFVKQIFGNVFRQELLDQLESKLNVENEESSSEELSEELSSEELSTSKATGKSHISTIYSEKFLDIFPLFFKFAGMTSCFPLMFTCKLFSEIITGNKKINYLRDLNLIKHIFKECQNTKYDFEIDITRISKNESKCLLLLAEFFPKEVTKITPPNKIYDRNLNYINHQQKLAIVLAKIDPKSALKVVASMNAELYPVQTFCAVAAIHKNSTLCDEKQVLAMGDLAYKERGDFRSISYQLGGELLVGRTIETFSTIFYEESEVNFIELFEASIGVHSSLEWKMLDLMKKYTTKAVRTDFKYTGNFIQEVAKMVKRIGVDLLIQSPIWGDFVDLLRKLMEINFDHNDRNYKFNKAKSMAILAKTLALFDHEKAIQALDLALNSVSELKLEARVGALIEIAEALAGFDQDKALEVANIALKEVQGLYAWNSGPEKYYHFRNVMFEFLSRIIKIIKISDIESAVLILEENSEKIRVMDENELSEYLKKYPDHKSDDGIIFLEQFPREVFMGAIELYASFNHKQALEMANLGVEWAKTRGKIARKNDRVISLKLSQILLKSFPDLALEVASMMSQSEEKCEALLSIVGQGSDYS